MSFIEIFTLLGSIATILGFIITLRRKSNDITMISHYTQNITKINSIKTLINGEEKEFQIWEAMRTPLLLFKCHITKTWLIVIITFLFLFLTSTSYLLLKHEFEHPITDFYTQLIIPSIITFSLLIFLFSILHHSRILVTKWFNIINYRKLYLTKYDGKCHCGGKIKLVQDYNNGRTYIVCQANKSHFITFDPNIFNKEAYVDM
jgi:hypothetical protein